MHPLISILLLTLPLPESRAANPPPTPQLASNWWTVATDPNLGALTGTNQISRLEWVAAR